MEGKNCTKCGEWKVLEAYHKRPDRMGQRRSQCAECLSVAQRERYAILDPGAVAQYNRQYARENRNAINTNRRERYERDPERFLAQQRAWREKNPDAKKEGYRACRDSLTDGYVAGRMRMPIAELPPELIEAKRIQLQIKRYLKNGNE